MPVVAKFVADVSNFTQALDRAETKLRDFSSGVGRIDKDLARFGDSFSGRKLIADASLMAKAIQDIGGASKLTEAEQRRVNATVTEAIAKYKALGQEAPKAITDLAEATARAEKPASLLNTRMLAIGSAIGTFAGNLANQAISAVGQSLLQAAQNAQRFTAVSTSFDRLAESVGESGDAMLSVTRTATKGLITDLDLMQSANKAMLLGLPVTSKEMGELSTAAVALGKAMGLDATQSLNDLITAFGRSSPLILDNLGLTVKVGEANEEYARKLGKTVGELTEVEKKMAFMEAGMEAARQKVEELGDQSLTATEQLSRLGTSAANVVTELAAGANEAEGFSGWLGTLADAAERASQRLSDLRSAQAKVGSNPFAISAEVDRLENERLFNMAAGTRPGLSLPAGPVIAGPTAAEQKAVEKASSDLARAIEQQSKAVKQAADEFKRLNVEMAELERGSTGVRAGFVPTVALAGQNLKAFAEPLPDLDRGLTRLADVSEDLLNQFAPMGPTLGEINQRFIDMNTVSDEVLNQFAEMTTSTSALGAAFTSAFSSIGPAITGALMGGGDVLKSAGSAFGGKLTQSIFGSEGMQKNITDIFGKTLGGAFNALLPGIGALAGPLISGIGKLFGKLFGGPSQEEIEGRGVAAKFRAEVESMLTDSQRLEAAGNAEKAMHIAIRDAIEDKSIAEQEASRLTRALWAAEKEGGDAVTRVYAEINRILSQQTPDAVAAVGDAVVSEVDRMAEAANAAMALVAAKHDAWMRKTWGDIGSGEGQPGRGQRYDLDANGNILTHAGDEYGQDLRDIVNSGLATGDQVNDFLEANDGDQQRALKAFRGYSTGTMGRYLDFGKGTPVVLHGRERVMTEAEGKAESTTWAAMAAKLDELATAQRRMLDELPRAIRTAVLVAR